MSETLTIVFRVDLGRTYGYGHVMRCLALAEILAEIDVQSVFVLRGDRSKAEQIRSSAVKSLWLMEASQPCVEPRWIADVVGEFRAPVVVIDTQKGVPLGYVSTLRRAAHCKVALFEGVCGGRLEADLIISPICRIRDAMQWIGFTGRRYEGPAYAILRNQFFAPPLRESARDGSLRVLVTMGGGDPLNLTSRVLHALRVVQQPLHLKVVVGALACQENVIAELRDYRHPYTLHREVRDMAGVMAGADLAICSFGTTVYELARMGVPALTIAISDDHDDAAQMYASYNVTEHLGRYDCVSDAEIAERLVCLAQASDRLQAMSQRGPLLVDGRGSERVARLIIDAISAYEPWEGRNLGMTHDG